METVMHKHLTNLTAFQAKTSSPVGSWDSAFKRWREARRFRREKRKLDEVVSQLTPQILYDIGVSDCRPSGPKSDIWDNHPYRLLMDAVIGRGPSRFDTRR
jgi:hypothetical protein